MIAYMENVQRLFREEVGHSMSEVGSTLRIFKGNDIVCPVWKHAEV